MCCYRSRLVFNLLLSLDILHLRCSGFLDFLLILTVKRIGKSDFDKVIRHTKIVPFLGHPVDLHGELYGLSSTQMSAQPVSETNVVDSRIKDRHVHSRRYFCHLREDGIPTSQAQVTPVGAAASAAFIQMIYIRKGGNKTNNNNARYIDIIGPIPWGLSGPLCHALSLSLSSLASSWTSMRRRRQ